MKAAKKFFFSGPAFIPLLMVGSLNKNFFAASITDTEKERKMQQEKLSISIFGQLNDLPIK